MVETNTWGKLGEVTWHAEVGLDDGDEPIADTVASAEYPVTELDAAKAWAEAVLLDGRSNPPARYEGGSPGHWWARLTRGTYRDESFTDPGHGPVCHADWEPDTDSRDTGIVIHAWLTDQGQVEWTDPDYAEPPLGPGVTP